MDYSSQFSIQLVKLKGKCGSYNASVANRFTFTLARATFKKEVKALKRPVAYPATLLTSKEEVDNVINE